MRHAEPARVVGLRYAISSDVHGDTMAVLRLALDDPDSPLAGREFEVNPHSASSSVKELSSGEHHVALCSRPLVLAVQMFHLVQFTGYTLHA